MDTHYLELISAIAATAVVSITAGWKLLDLRFYKFQGQLIEKLNGRYIRRDKCEYMHDSTVQKVELIREDVQRIVADLKDTE